MIDAIILGVLFISILIGWFRGAVKEICSVISWVLSGYLAWKLFPIGLELVREHISQPLLAKLVTGFSLFVVFMLVLSLLTYLFSALVRNSVFSIADKFCGSLYGIVRGILVIAIVEFGLTYYVFNEPPAAFQQSKLLPYVKNISQMLFLMLPDNIQKELTGYLSKNKQRELIVAFGGKMKDSLFAQKNSSLASTPHNSDVDNQPSDTLKEDSQNNRASELAHLGVKKVEPNPNLNKSVRSDLDKLIDQYT